MVPFALEEKPITHPPLLDRWLVGALAMVGIFGNMSAPPETGSDYTNCENKSMFGALVEEIVGYLRP